jgi:lysophospholipase L1-like esterase
MTHHTRPRRYVRRHARQHDAYPWWFTSALTLFVALCTGLTVVSSLAAVGPRPAAATARPVVIEVVGDSITVAADVPGGWREPLADLIQNATGSRPIIRWYAAGGWSTADAWPGFPASMAAWNPDLVLYALGTNDGWDPQGAQTRTSKVLGAINDMTAANVAVSFVAYSDPVRSGQPNLANLQASVNDALYRAYQAAGFWSATPPARYAGLADFQALGGNCLDAKGVHPNAAGYQLMAALWFNAMAGKYGWSKAPLPTGCATNGHRP